MTGSVDTILTVTGDFADLTAANASAHPLAAATFIELAGDKITTFPEPSVDDRDRWVFPGTQSGVFLLAKTLSRIHPTLQWVATIPDPVNGETYRYVLRGGTGIAERTSTDTANSPVAVPDGSTLTLRYAVGDQSNILEAVLVVTDGSEADITDEYLGRGERNSFAHLSAGDLTASLTYDDDDIAALLNNAH